MKLGIVGGGGASVALLAALTRTQVPPIDITLFEPAPSAGPGRAYLADTHTSLLNVTAQRMSLFPDTPGDFWAWLGKTQASGLCADGFAPGSYLPRHLFGQYLENTVCDIAQRVTRSGRCFEIQKSTVSRLIQDRRSISLETDDSRRFSGFDRIVLCVGVGSTQDLHGLRGHAACINDPYPLRDRLAAVEPSRDVVVLGAGLTSVDVVLFLLSRGHVGRITMVSRNGLLPSVRTSANAPTLHFLSPAAMRQHLETNPEMTLERLFRLFDAELKLCGMSLARVCAEAKSGENFHRRLRRQLHEAESGGALWQPIMIQVMHGLVEHIWRAMPMKDRSRFLSEWHTRFISLLSPVPQETARKLLIAADTGQLRVERCHPTAHLYTEPGGVFKIPLATGSIVADVIINTIRPSKAAIPPQATTLVESITKSGAARLHPLGGIDIDPDSNRLVDAKGLANVRLFALGQLTAGVHYFTNSMLKISQQATIIADRLIAEVN